MRYSKVEKVALALIYSARRLRFGFNSVPSPAHAIRVITEYPLKSILGKTDLPGRVAKWAVQLGEFDIRYEPRTAEKGQALASFLADFPVESDIGGDYSIDDEPTSMANVEKRTPDKLTSEVRTEQIEDYPRPGYWGRPPRPVCSEFGVEIVR